MPASFTPSSRWRATNCPASTYLPRAKRESGRAANRGTGYHAFKVRVHEVGYTAALAEVPADAPHRSLCEACDPSSLTSEHARHEVAFVYDAANDTARVLDDVHDRAYPETSYAEIPGTADTAVVPPEGAITVDDTKTGQPSPAYWPQLGLYALALARAFNRDEAHVRVIYVDEHTKEARIFSRSFDAFALEAEAASVRELVSTLAASRAEYERSGFAETRAGEWCRYCDARPNCPEYASAGRELTRAEDGFVARAERECSTPDGLARWFLFAERARQLLADVEKIVDTAARAAGPVDLGDGRTLALVPGEPKRRITDADALHDALTSEGRNVETAFTVERATTVGAVVKALGGAKKATPVLERLIARGDAGIAVTSPEQKLDAIASTPTNVVKLERGAA